MYKDDSLVFVEVKHWLTMAIDDLSYSITEAKRRRIFGCSREFVTQYPEWSQCRFRFDILHIGAEQISHFKNAFTENGFQ